MLEAFLREAGRDASLLLLQHQRAFLADQRRELLGHHAEQPRQRDFELDVILPHVDRAVRGLPERADTKVHAIAHPGLFIDGEELGVVLPRIAEARPDAAQRLILAEPMRDGNDEGFCHWSSSVPPPNVPSRRTWGLSRRMQCFRYCVPPGAGDARD